jgi:hypothetical protein
MARTWIRQDVQIGSTTDTVAGYADTTAPSLANYQTNASTITDDLNNLRSQVHNLLKVQSGSWYDDISTPSTFENGAKRGVDGINQDLHDYERKRVLREVSLLTDVATTAAASATGTLTLTGNAADTETVTIGTKVYTFQTVLTDVDGNVLIGATASDSLDNLIAAINLDAGAGTLYATSMTVNTDVTAAAGAGDTMDVTAKKAGETQNTVATTDTVTNGSWGGATLSGGAGLVHILGGGELPTQTTVAIGTVTTLGTVAQTASSFGTPSATDAVSGATAVNPANLFEIVDGSTRDPILDTSGRRIWAMFQCESSTDGSTMTGTTPNRAQLSFVVLNSTGDGLELVDDASDIGSKTINYTYIERKALEDLNEYDFLRGAAVDIGSGAATINRQVAYTNQGTTPVNVTTNAFLDLESAGIEWTVRDDLEANLFRIIEGSAGGTSEIEIGANVDLYDNNAVDVDFASGATVNSGGTRPIDIGVTDGVIESTAGDLMIKGFAELLLDDANQTGSTWAQDGIKLSDTTAEWDTFETNFGEVSLLSAINQAYTGTVRTKIQATLTSNVTAGNDVNGPTYANNTDVDLAPYNNVTFVSDVDVVLNGELLRNAVGATEDVYPGTSQSQGDLKFTFNLRGVGTKPDQITVIVYGQ